MKLGVFALTFALSFAPACASPQPALDAAVVTANGAAAIATEGHAVLAALYRDEQMRCLDLDLSEAKACVSRVRARYERTWIAYDVLRATWLASAAIITAARAADRMGSDPVSADKVVIAVQEIIAAEQALAAALQAARGDVQ